MIIEAVRTVAPYAGAWIEIMRATASTIASLVAPYAGAWIEIEKATPKKPILEVAPYAGAWIEIFSRGIKITSLKSLPTRERGLKF